MKTYRKIFITLFITAVLTCCFAIFSFAEGADISASLSFKANAEDSNTVVNVQNVDGENYMFLPSDADLTALALYYDEDIFTSVTLSTDNSSVDVISGEAFDFSALFTSSSDEYTVTVTADGNSSLLTIMKSASIRSLFLVSDNPDEFGREWVDQSKSNEATGLISIVNTNGEVDYTGKLTQIKPRGNTTFTQSPKKAYQIKLDKKTDLVGGNKDEANKKWILLANYFDDTLIHNSVTFGLAEDLGIKYTHSFDAVDLYYDGEYRGSYLLTEKSEVASSRVDIEDLDKLIEEANDGNEAYETPSVITATTASKGEKTAKEDSEGSYKYVTGLNEPALAEGTTHHGYLLELEYTDRYRDELTGFVTLRGKRVVTSNPEYLTKDTGAYISAFWQEFENAVFSKNGYNKSTGKYYYDYCDMDSLVKVFLINTLAKNYDTFGSSAFFYLPEDEDIMYAGPVWDYDISFGSEIANREYYANPENFNIYNWNYMYRQLLEIESFRDALKVALNPTDGEFYLAVKKLTGENGVIELTASQMAESEKMDTKLWNIFETVYCSVAEGAEPNYENAVDFFESFVDARINWMSDTICQWHGNSYKINTDTTSYNSFTAFFQKIIDFFKMLFALIGK